MHTMLFGHNSRVHSIHSCLVCRTLVKKTLLVSPFGDTCNAISQWPFSTMPWLAVLPHCLSAHIKMESLRHNLEYTGTHFLLLDTQNPHFIWKKCIVAWLEAWSRLWLKPIYSISSHREQWDKCQIQKPSWGRHLAGSHHVLGQCWNRWRLTFPSYLLPLRFTLSSFFFHLGSCHLFWRYSVSEAILSTGIVFWRHRRLFQITKHYHLKYSMEWERAGSGRSLLVQLIQAAFLPLFLQAFKSVQPQDPECLTTTS